MMRRFETKMGKPWVLASFALSLLAACGTGLSSSQRQETSLVDAELVAPEVLSLTATGAWDGQATLGGVWVAHQNVKTPERVTIRDTETGASVVGSLFRKDPDPTQAALQVSLDAAAALGLAANEQRELTVIALRRAPRGPSDLDPKPSQVTLPAQTDEAALQQTVVSSLAKPFVQIGIFHVESNATKLARRLRNVDATPVIKPGTLNGKPFWRVVVGPARDQSELETLLNTVRTEGFSDAYPVTD